jgi:hypothetical protein
VVQGQRKACSLCAALGASMMPMAQASQSHSSTRPTHIVLITFPHRLIIRMTKCFVDRTIEEEHVAKSFIMFYVV